VPVTVIEAGPCPVVAVLDGRVELGFGAKKPKNAPRRWRSREKRLASRRRRAFIRRFDVTGDAPRRAPRSPWRSSLKAIA